MPESFKLQVFSYEIEDVVRANFRQRTNLTAQTPAWDNEATCSIWCASHVRDRYVLAIVVIHRHDLVPILLKSSFLIALICATRLRIPASPSTNQGPAKNDFIPLWRWIMQVRDRHVLALVVIHHYDFVPILLEGDQILHEKTFNRKTFWNGSLLLIFSNITSKDHAV